MFEIAKNYRYLGLNHKCDCCFCVICIKKKILWIIKKQIIGKHRKKDLKKNPCLDVGLKKNYGAIYLSDFFSCGKCLSVDFLDNFFDIFRIIQKNLHK